MAIFTDNFSLFLLATAGVFDIACGQKTPGLDRVFTEEIATPASDYDACATQAGQRFMDEHGISYTLNFGRVSDVDWTDISAIAKKGGDIEEWGKAVPMHQKSAAGMSHMSTLNSHAKCEKRAYSRVASLGFSGPKEAYNDCMEGELWTIRRALLNKIINPDGATTIANTVACDKDDRACRYRYENLTSEQKEEKESLYFNAQDLEAVKDEIDEATPEDGGQTYHIQGYIRPNAAAPTVDYILMIFAYEKVAINTVNIKYGRMLAEGIKTPHPNAELTKSVKNYLRKKFYKEAFINSAIDRDDYVKLMRGKNGERCPRMFRG